MTAENWISRLQLKPHPEGGYFSETYVSAEAAEGLPERFIGVRPLSTAIYYLLGAHDFSALHRLKADEVWHHYDGGILQITGIDGGGNLHRILLGKGEGCVPQAVVPAGWWFGAAPLVGDYVLAGCTVAPGFDFADFEMGRQSELLAQFPQYADLIRKLSR